MDPIIENLNKNIDVMIEDATEFLAKMIKIPTENPPGTNYEQFADLCSAKLMDEGYRTEIIEVPTDRLQELCEFGNGPRPSVIGTKGSGNIKIALNGHYDVVPAGRGWKTNSFMSVNDGKFIYGRGSSDMKGGIAMQVYGIKLLENTFPDIWKKLTVTQTAVPDEETVGNKNAGMYYLVESGKISRENTDFVIYTEPLGVNNICYGHRGAIFITVKVIGKKSHGSMAYLGKDAIAGTIELISIINKYGKKIEKSRISKYNVIPPGSKKPGLAIGYLKCGTWANTIADECEFSIYRRLIPEEKLSEEKDKLYDLIMDYAQSSGYEVRINEHYITDSIIENTENQFYRLFRTGLGEALGSEPELVLSPGTFDMRFTHQAGIPSLNYGPGILEESHMNDEKILINDLKKSIVGFAAGLYEIARGL